MIDQFLPGYTLFITSYLGDADYYDTKVVTGLTIEQARAVEKFVRACISGYNFPEESIYNRDSNSFDLERVDNRLTKEDLWLLAETVFSKPSVPEDPEALEQDLKDIVVELMGYSDPYTDHLRSFDSLKAVYFTEPVQLRSTFL